MSNIPLLFPKEGREAFAQVLTARDLPGRVGAAAKLRPRHFKPEIGLLMGLTDPVCGLNMGETAELLAKEHGISREEQDAFALRSHQRATAARARLAEEIVPVPIPPDYREMATEDNGVRENQTMEALAKLRPYFDRKFGTVTAGNSSQITDGGAATLVMSAQAAKAGGFKPLGRIRGSAFAALEPERMGLGPAVAVLNVSGIGANGKLAPVVKDGMMQPVLEFADSAQIIRQSLWVETNFDSDRDGKLDLLAPQGDNLEDSYAWPQPYHGCLWLRNLGNWNFQPKQIARFGGTYAAFVERSGCS
jgi:hypothetical protein